MRWAWLAVLLAACAHKTPEQKLAGDIAPASSWVSTFEFTCDRWLANRVPSKFVREAVEAGDKVLDKARQSTEQSKANDAMRGAVRQWLEEARVASDDLQAAIERGDRAAVARIRVRFAAAHASLHKIEEDNR